MAYLVTLPVPRAGVAVSASGYSTEYDPETDSYWYYWPSNAWDGNTSTYWYLYGPIVGSWFQLDFPLKQKVRRIDLYGLIYSQMVLTIQSWNGTSWVDIQSFSVSGGSASLILTSQTEFTKLRITVTSAVYSGIFISEVVLLYEATFGDDLCVSPSRAIAVSGPVANLTDNNTSTAWISQYTGQGTQWAGYDFGIPVAIGLLRLYMASWRVGGKEGVNHQTPDTQYLEGWDGSTWVTVQTLTGCRGTPAVVTCNPNKFAYSKWRLCNGSKSSLGSYNIHYNAFQEIEMYPYLPEAYSYVMEVI